ncbi:MAG: hypothetical protein KBA81_05530 [Rhabdochlamydiaceae bacterium]|nr:hypothetical protein [Rhabdochlamydiaceae bacterium]
MNTHRDEESVLDTVKRVWRWLSRKPEELGEIHSIFDLNIGENTPSNELLSFIPFEITYFSYLKELTLSGHLLTEVPAFLRRLQLLRTLSLQNNHIREVYCPFRKMASLKKVNLTHNRLTSFPSKELFHPNRSLFIMLDAPVALNADRPESVFCDFNFSQLDPTDKIILHTMEAVLKNLTLLEKIAPSKALEQLINYYSVSFVTSRNNSEDFLAKLEFIQQNASELIREHLFPKQIVS